MAGLSVLGNRSVSLLDLSEALLGEGVHRFWTFENGMFSVELDKFWQFKTRWTSTPSLGDRKNALEEYRCATVMSVRHWHCLCVR